MTEPMTPRRARSLLDAAEPHLASCEIMAIRRLDSARGDSRPVERLARAAPALARAYLASEERLERRAIIADASAAAEAHDRRVRAEALREAADEIANGTHARMPEGVR